MNRRAAVRDNGRNLQVFTVFLTHSRQDRPVACELVGFIERGMSDGVLVDSGEIGEGENLLDKTGEGLSAQAILVLLSPASVPGQWARDEWMRALIHEPRDAGVPIAFLLCGDCRIPELLRRGKFFELGNDPLAAFRKVKHWLLEVQPARPDPPRLPRPVHRGSRETELETLRCAIADKPGLALIEGPPGAGKTALAAEFADRHESDFEWTVWVDCAHRGAAGIAGDLASVLGLRLERSIAESNESVRRFLETRRVLLVLDGADATAAGVVAGGSTSVLLTARRTAGEWQDRAAVHLRLPGAPAEHPPLDDRERTLMEAMCACAPSGFPLAIAAHAAGMSEMEASKLAAQMAEKRAVVDLGGARYAVPCIFRDASLPPAPVQQRYREAVARRLAACALSGGFEDYGDARHAVAWCFSDNSSGDDDWRAGCDIAWRAASLAREAGRMPEAHEFLMALFTTAEQRQDREWLRPCVQELIWILNSWDNDREVEHFEAFLRRSCDDQFWLPFMTA